MPLSLLLIGLVAGLLSGIMGVGGGIILIPALLFKGVNMHQAVGISLAVIVPTALAGAYKHYQAGNVDMKMTLWIVVGAVGGAVLGAVLATRLPGAMLRRIFGVFIILIGLDLTFSFSARLQKDVKPASDSIENLTKDE